MDNSSYEKCIKILDKMVKNFLSIKLDTEETIDMLYQQDLTDEQRDLVESYEVDIMSKDLRARVPWKNPLVNVPPDGAKVFAIDWHWKQEIPGSYQIVGGVVQHHEDRNEITLYQIDEFGAGSQRWHFPTKDNEFYNDVRNCNCLGGWCYAEELNLPYWLKEDENSI